MKLSQSVFYDLESTKQEWHYWLEAYPFCAAGVGFVFFLGFALKTHISSKLYKEAIYSLILGGAVAGIYPYQLR